MEDETKKLYQKRCIGFDGEYFDNVEPHVYFSEFEGLGDGICEECFRLYMEERKKLREELDGLQGHIRGG